MYTFDDNGESLTLRPEGTAPTVRAALEHNLLYDGPKRLWYSGPLFRHERPQKGRYRQYHTFGAEALGFAGPDIDIEQLRMVSRVWRVLGLEDVTLEINTIGSADERRAFRETLVRYFEQHRDTLDADSQRRLTTNPLRILDSKNPAMQALIEAAPKLMSSLGAASRETFAAIEDALRSAGIPYRVNPRLVRGLDYYNRTVFEFVTPNIGAQATIAGGGRYDALFAQLGGKPTPACGFGMGMERVLLAMKAAGAKAQPVVDVFVVHSGEAAEQEAWRLAESWRDAGRNVVMGPGGSFKSQMKKADASGARFAVIIGDDEVAARRVTLKPLRGGDGQRTLDPHEALAEVTR
jgi:histidyl-tRNA synthetase